MLIVTRWRVQLGSSELAVVMDQQVLANRVLLVASNQMLARQGVLHAAECVLLADTPLAVVAALLERVLTVLPVWLEPTGWGALELQLDHALDVPPIITALLAMVPPLLTLPQPAQLA